MDAEPKVTAPLRVGLLAVGLLGANLAAQEVRLRDRSPLLAATYDPTRDRIVALGANGEIVEWDHRRWYQRPLALFGGAPYGGRLVYDSRGNRIVSVQVTFDFMPNTAIARTATMLWDSHRWQTLQPAASPPPRVGHGLAFDAARDEVVLFGGLPYSPSQSLDDTWVFDGTNWQQRQPAFPPWHRYGAGMSYDPVRARTVLFGGVSFPSYLRLHDTVEWDGTNWISLQPTSMPTPSADLGLAMAFDPARNRTVLVGESATGAWDDIWEYDGVTWTAVPTPAPAPRERTGATLVFDGGSGECVLLGGTAQPRAPTDTWSWNGSRWLQLAAAPPEPPFLREDRVLVDPGGRGLVVLETESGTPSVTWTFDGSTWRRLPGAAQLSRDGASTATGPTYAYLYGGIDLNQPNAPFLSELWGFDGATWNRLAGQGPVGGPGAALGYDWLRGELVLYGGQDAAGALLAETWIFDGAGWQQRFPATNPPPLGGALTAFDLARGVLVMHRSNLYGGPNGTWEWNGTDWRLVTTVTPTQLSGIAFDLQRGQVVGIRVQSTTAGPQFVAFDGTAWRPLPIPEHPIEMPMAFGWPFGSGMMFVGHDDVFTVGVTASAVDEYGSPCTATAPALLANEWPRPGATGFALEIAGAPANSLVLLLGGIQRANLAVGSCTQLVPPGQSAVLLPSSGIGVASAALPIPNQTAFFGRDLFFQVAALDAVAPTGFTLSRGLRLTIGD
ncbi:MAG: hypothetical protein KDE27_32620 [Planctomycetes bacterium]|nr:hypothetical protein [Planctomycetota bacterium]